MTIATNSYLQWSYTITGLDLWIGLVDWTGGLDWWTGGLWENNYIADLC